MLSKFTISLIKGWGRQGWWKWVCWCKLSRISCMHFKANFLLFLWKTNILNLFLYYFVELRGLDLQTGIFTLRQIKAATSNFDAANKLGEGGFGSVYKVNMDTNSHNSSFLSLPVEILMDAIRNHLWTSCLFLNAQGTLADGTIIAVKQLSSKSRQGNREFVNEIGMMSGLHHPNLVRLYGCCVERNQLLLVYEYMENNNLSHALFGKCYFWILDFDMLYLSWESIGSSLSTFTG